MKHSSQDETPIDSSSVQKINSFITKFDDKVVQWGDKYTKWWDAWKRPITLTFKMLATVFVALNVAYWLPNQRYQQIYIFGVSPLEIMLLINGLWSVMFLFVWGMYLLSDITDAIKRIYQRIIITPASRIRGKLTRLALDSILWKFPFRLGQKIGYEFVLYPALSYLEPDIDQRTIGPSTLDQLPPLAYIDEQFCDTTLQRYRINYGSTVVLLGMIAPFILLGIIGCPLVVISGQGSSSFIGVTFSILVFITIAGIFPYWSGFSQPMNERIQAWVNCRDQLRRRRELEEEATNIGSNITQQIQVNIERLHQQYETESQKNRLALDEQVQAINQLKHIVEQPDVDEQTVKMGSYFISLLDQRRKVDAIIQEDRTKSEHLFNVKVNAVAVIISAILGLILGKVFGNTPLHP